ncbi:flagellar basal-body rod protein FlgF [Legionella erythra]|uniref:flagellar basal-body rod protein FlgF n=1 Tax=Legionella erythra TaxID=448 RepID=UPI001041B209|nr:flagellar basal-body rod protein FlgF [Legionella erythra]
MEPILYNAMHGSQVNFDRQNVTANNLANANTPGFKADLFQAESMFVVGPAIIDQALPIEEANGTNFSQGGIMTTGRDLDVAIQGPDGWFSVQDAQKKEAYTRAGDFHLTSTGMLVTASGLPVLGDGGPISIPPAKSINIGNDGTISIVPLDGDPREVSVIDRLKVVKIEPKNLTKGLDGLMHLPGGAAVPDPAIRVVNGALEGSNVNAVTEMVNMIAAGREFEAQLKVMQTVDENAQRLAQLLQE